MKVKIIVFLLKRPIWGLVLGVTCNLLLILLLVNYSHSNISQYKDSNSTDLVINFLLPMQQDQMGSGLSITSEIPTTKISYSVEWLNYSTALIKIKQEELSHGQLITVRIKQAPTKLPLITKSFETSFRPRVSVSLVSDIKMDNVCSKGPVHLYFNAPIVPDDIGKFIELPVPGKMQPVKLKYRGKTYTDYSHWQYIPNNSFEHSTSYELLIKPGLRNQGGGRLPTTVKVTFNTTPPLKVLSTNPTNISQGVSLYKKLEIVLNQSVSKASIKVTDLKTKKPIKGLTVIEGKTIVFKPDHSYLPGRNYSVNVQVEAKNKESLKNYRFIFSTRSMDGIYWLDVKLGSSHTVTVYKGEKIIRQMKASGGRPETPTPLGFFYTQDRGHSFWSPRFGEGATYWIRLVGQVLIHSVPRDNKWEIKKDQHEKLGLPASHGCIRLSEEDAKWVFQNIPRGTLVIIHP